MNVSTETVAALVAALAGLLALIKELVTLLQSLGGTPALAGA